VIGRVGLALPQSFVECPPPQRDTWLELIEAPSVDAAWTLDQPSGRAATLEPLSALAFAAALTTRVRLGVAVLVPAARGPLATAKAVTTVDRASRGRLIVGLGLGGRHHYGSYGIDVDRHRTGDLLDDAVEIMTRIWSGDAVGASGGPWHLDGVHIEPRPLQRPHPPLWFGGGGRKAMLRTAHRGAGWIGAGRHSTKEFADNRSLLEEVLAEAGRPADDLVVAKRVYLLVDDRLDRARGTTAEWFGQFYGRPELGEAVTVLGPPSRCAEQLDELYALGADHLVLHPLADDIPQFERVVHEVIPGLGG
jgi:alkanesulfonate monooxygenase SsuD/methylene tetrahydromethanopterin reductase-like flavin-dependent oxidoreductase (luciferase family)